MPRIEHYWQSINPVTLALWPLSLLFGALAGLRRAAYRAGLLRSGRFPVPVIVVGNITVGGTGKTPLVGWLVRHLRERGLRPGVVARGYRGTATHWPQAVRADSDPASVGDEAVMLAALTGCPVSVGPDRSAAVAALLQRGDIDIVIADDGLQHYALARDLEIAVIDGERRCGNGWLLPAGPLREPVRRLRSVDLVIVNGGTDADPHRLELRHPTVTALHGDGERALADFAGGPVHAIAGIGHPQRFFALLDNAGLDVHRHPFPDHHAYRDGDLALEPSLPILMTDKDAVKCRHLRCDDCWVVHVDAQPDAAFVARLDAALEDMINGQETA